MNKKEREICHKSTSRVSKRRLKTGMNFRGLVWKRVWKWHFLVWNRVMFWRTGLYTPTKNSQECPRERFAADLPLVASGEAANNFFKRQSCNRLSPDVGFWMRPRFSPLEVGRIPGRAVGRSCEGKSQFYSSPYFSRLNSLNYNHWLQKDPLDETFKPDKVPRRLWILRRIIHAPSKWSKINPLALTTFTFFAGRK